MLVNVLDDEMSHPNIHIIASILAWTSAAINPFVYSLQNQQYQAAFKSLFCFTQPISNSLHQVKNEKLSIQKLKLTLKSAFLNRFSKLIKMTIYSLKYQAARSKDEIKSEMLCPCFSGSCDVFIFCFCPPSTGSWRPLQRWGQLTPPLAMGGWHPPLAPDAPL